jgi:hypothetical protein
MQMVYMKFSFLLFAKSSFENILNLDEKNPRNLCRVCKVFNRFFSKELLIYRKVSLTAQIFATDSVYQMSKNEEKSCEKAHSLRRETKMSAKTLVNNKISNRKKIFSPTPNFRCKLNCSQL